MTPAEPKSSSTRTVHVTCHECGKDIAVRTGALDKPVHCGGCGFLLLLWSDWADNDTPPVKSLRAHLAHRLRGIRELFSAGAGDTGREALRWLAEHVKCTYREADGQHDWPWHNDDLSAEVRAALPGAIEEIAAAAAPADLDCAGVAEALGELAAMLENNRA